MLDESADRDDTDVQSDFKSSNSLKSLLQSKICEIKGKSGANYQRHGSFCINSLGLPAEDIGVSFRNHISKQLHGIKTFNLHFLETFPE